MKNVDLQEKVQKMLDGEAKRREIAIKWLQEVEKILLPVAHDIWGDGDDPYNSFDITNSVKIINKNKEGKIDKTDFYFRYETHYGTNNNVEHSGFYLSDSGELWWGKNIKDLYGKDFWYVIQIVMEWLPIVAENMEKRSEGREALLAKLA